MPLISAGPCCSSQPCASKRSSSLARGDLSATQPSLTPRGARHLLIAGRRIAAVRSSRLAAADHRSSILNPWCPLRESGPQHFRRCVVLALGDISHTKAHGMQHSTCECSEGWRTSEREGADMHRRPPRRAAPTAPGAAVAWRVRAELFGDCQTSRRVHPPHMPPSRHCTLSVQSAQSRTAGQSVRAWSQPYSI